ncbi:hypothetical protein J3D55_002441 [Chryseobacterium ginsenosidimutans]|uniref:hypothetical protein n=1 Tax=Chryseobacterium ginsenosidimutans TaxID=687846 RepID=UPI002168988A|nr:hypothetical protein [Chryseobacterium ginsenosidimutans]MCS3869525.1 hypothetical protein [Chryseobacterium ginsenosidimutans]
MKKRLLIWINRFYLINYQYIKYMHNLIQNYEIILKELTKSCGDIQSIKQIRVPKRSDLELIAFNITAEYMSINSELQLFRSISGTDMDDKVEKAFIIPKKESFSFY